MEVADRRELQRFVTTLHSTVRAGPYNDAAAHQLLNLYPSILHFWNRLFAHYAEILGVMQAPQTATREGNEAHRELTQVQISHIAVINAECEGAEKMAGIINTFFGKRQQLLARRGFILTLRVSRRGDDAEPDTRLLQKGIEAHLRHWGPWWIAWEEFLRFVHRDLASEMKLFYSVLNPSCDNSKSANIKVIDALEKRLSRLSEVDTNEVLASSELHAHDQRFPHIQDLLHQRRQALRQLRDLLGTFQKSPHTETGPGRILRKRKRGA